MRNTDPVNKMMLNLLDSHDTHRFFKEVGKDRFKMKAALALLFLFPGVPCIFYGTEILTEGGYDPDCRRCMDWEKARPEGEYRDVYELLRILSSLKKDLDISDGTVKIYAESEVLILTNMTGKNEIKLQINNTSKNQMVNSVEMQPYSFSISRNGRMIAHE